MLWFIVTFLVATLKMEGFDTSELEDPNEFNTSGEDSSGDSNCSDSSLSPEEGRELQEAIENATKKVAILCAGPTGVGKSTLLNGLIGSEEGEGERRRKDDCDDPEINDEFGVGGSLKRGTSKVHKREFVKNGVAVTVWDTPGLEGDIDADDAYMESIKKECADFDLFMYCIKADDTKATETCDEKSSLLKFTELFGPNMWKNGIIVLTFCNGIVTDLEEDKECNPDIDIGGEFTQKIQEWKKKLHEALLRKGVDKKIVKKIPVVPAGSAHIPHLPGYNFWLSLLFVKVQERMKDKAQVAYILLNEDRMRSRSDVDERAMGKTEIHDQPLVEVAAGLGVAAVGTAIGAGLGATIGALAIGIPSFGVFAGAGLVLGGAIGAGVGGVSGVGTGLLIRWFKKKRRRAGRKKK